MALTDNGNELVMPVQPMGGYGNGSFGGFGGDWGSLIVLFLIAAMFGGFGGGFGLGGWGGMGGFAADGAMLYPWMNQANITSEGFQNQLMNDNITSIRDGVHSLSTQLCNCCADMQMALANGFAGVEQGANARQMANMQQAFATQTAMNQGFNATQAQLAQIGCDNKAAIADVKYTIASEACATRQNSTANSQAILDKLCQIELDNVKNQVAAEQRENANLRTELMYARGQASQIEQTAILRQGQEAEVDALYNRLKNCPVGTTPVYGNQPIFTCPQTAGCGCSGNF